MLVKVNIRIFCKSVHNIIRHATVSINWLEIKIQMNVIETSTWVLALAMINVFFSAAYSILFFFNFFLSLFLPPIQGNIQRKHLIKKNHLFYLFSIESISISKTYLVGFEIPQRKVNLLQSFNLSQNNHKNYIICLHSYNKIFRKLYIYKIQQWDLAFFSSCKGMTKFKIIKYRNNLSVLSLIYN